MEHEQVNVSESQNAIPQLMGSGNIFNVESDGFVKILKERLFDVETLTAIGSLGGNALKQVYTDAHLSNRNLNNTFRTLALGTMALIPYGGVFISSQVGLLWPENVETRKNQIKKMMVQLATRMDEKIAEYDLDGHIKEVGALMKRLRPFEDLVNGKLHVSESYFSKGNMQESNRIVAKFINDSFIRVIDRIQKDTSKVGKLPIFTIIATAHLQFLYFIEKNGQGLNIQFDTESFNRYFMTDYEKTTEKYVSYAQKTYEMGRQKFVKKMQDIAKFEIGNYSLDDQENLSEMRKYYEQIFVHGATEVSLTAKRKIVNLAIAINEYENLMIEKEIYYNETWGNEAFFQVVKMEKQDNKKYQKN
ncbi:MULTISPECIES: insecticidal delta-endotoxin Cry8Ea1 family protein [Bacillus cereus group]|uniref:insecticidal delta-endotoxin Cry8Ea1 family protein n=1 Tax=Bacillus cereus group TaxID=86661 RepID=UPI000D916E4A|nr:insecticidal delta-endotoxin Cry8Ea1 family protein [Bacillus cereus]SPT76078.1 delta endotoxin, N-terminal domain [Bacillus cereus]